jgi:HEAT repeat-containing protein 5
VFPKSQPKDAMTTRSEAEWIYLFFARESALSALYSFLVFNSKELVTPDVAKRILVCLNNVLQFLGTVSTAYASVIDQTPPTAFHFKLYERECLLRKRLFKCLKAIGTPQTFDSIYTPIIRATIDTFAPDPERPERFTHVQKDGTVSIESVLHTSLVHGLEFNVAVESGAEDRGISKLTSSDMEVQQLEKYVSQNAFRNFENDVHYLYLGRSGLDEYDQDPHKKQSIVNDMPLHSQISVVDSAIELFALIFANLTTQTQETLMEQLIKAATFNAGRITPLRKTACQLNSLVAAIGILKHAMVKRGDGKLDLKIYVGMRDLAQPFLKSTDAVLRSAGCEIFGRLARVNGSAMFVNPMMEIMVDLVVNNRDPESRAGASLAMGATLSYVGGMSAGSHLKTVVQVLHSLAGDPHPLVHTWALQALYLTIESAGLMFGPFVNSTLSLIVKLYMSESHEISAVQANMIGYDTNAHVYPCLGRILYALLGVIG